VIGVVAEMTVIDRDLRDGPIIATFHGEILSRGGNREQHRRRAERGYHGLAHVIASLAAETRGLRGLGRRRQIGGNAGECGAVLRPAIDRLNQFT
jgi:hypothetical protein